jgi:tRNA pseudouridine38-40 synthase
MPHLLFFALSPQQCGYARGLMKNIKLILSYNGSKFNGYQTQPNVVTVQETLNSAWRILTGESVILLGCSRLDSQVHANYYVLNFYSETLLLEEKILRALNGILHNQLKAEICIYNCEFVDENFHSRFHAKGKHYRYLIWYGQKTHALLTPRCWHIHSKNSLENLAEIMQQYIGEHDFAGFRASDCSSKQTLKTIYNIQTRQHIQFPEMFIIDIFGDGFLKNMIRNMVGTAVQVSIKKLHDTCILEAFEHKNREQVGVCAPGWALTLMKVYYSKEELVSSSKSSHAFY